jgi:hypothetical protein
MPKFRKKPVEIEAIRFTKSNFEEEFITLPYQKYETICKNILDL